MGSNVYDGKSYYNSGTMTNVPDFPGGKAYTTYSLTFAVTGDFKYYSLVNSSMIGMIHVRPANTAYPYSQAEYNAQIAHATQKAVSEGNALEKKAASMSNNHQVTDGIDNGMVGIMRFFPQHIVVHVGDTVVFTNRDVMEPHNVVFGTLPSFDGAQYGKPSAFDGSALASGFLWYNSTYKVKFVKAGNYEFSCSLHDYLGMSGQVVVLP